MPFTETAVVLNVYDRKGRKIDQKRQFMVEDVSDFTYNNANFIKSSFHEINQRNE